MELNDADKIIDLYNQEIQMGNGYRWSVNFKFDYGEYPDYPEDGYVLYADFIDGNGNKHISDNTAFITMNDDENTIEKKVSRFMDNLKFSDTNDLKESKIIKEAIKIPSSAKRKGQNLIKGIEELYRISETKPNDWLQMYDENDWSFYIKYYKFNDKNMTFTWKEKSGELHNDRSVSNEKEKFVANGEFDFYGEFNDFVNYWNKLVRKTKKYLEMDSRELDRKLGYDVDDDELEESKKIVKESNENMNDLAQEIFNETKEIMYNRYRGQRGTPFTVNTFVYQYMKNPKFHKFQVEINASLAEGLGIDSDYLTYEQSIFYKSFNIKFDEDRFKDMISDYLDNEVEEGVLICDNDNRIKEYYAV